MGTRLDRAAGSPGFEKFRSSKSRKLRRSNPGNFLLRGAAGFPTLRPRLWIHCLASDKHAHFFLSPIILPCRKLVPMRISAYFGFLRHDCIKLSGKIPRYGITCWDTRHRGRVMAMILLIPQLNNSISLLLPTELAIASSTSNREFKNIYVLCEIHVLPSRLTLNIQHYSTVCNQSVVIQLLFIFRHFPTKSSRLLIVSRHAKLSGFNLAGIF